MADGCCRSLTLLTKKERHRSWEAEGSSPGIQLTGTLLSGPPTPWAFTPWGCPAPHTPLMELPPLQLPSLEEEAASTEPS